MHYLDYGANLQQLVALQILYTSTTFLETTVG